MVDLEERVYRLEVVLEKFIKSVEIAQMRTEAEIRALKDEMKAFKDEMRDFKNEMKDFKDEMRSFKNEMKVFKDEMLDFKNEMKDFKDEMRDEMRDFKDEMLAFKEESRRERAEMNKRWGEITNKLGTFAEDMVAPNIKGIAKRYFGCEDFDFFGVRVKKRHSKDKSKRREFDCIAVCEDMVILNETKANPKIEYINDFIDVLKEFYDYFPEYKDKKLIPIFASMYLGDDLVSYLTKNGIYAMAIKEDTMDLLNYENVAK
jgi:gas vesicle protein